MIAFRGRSAGHESLLRRIGLAALALVALVSVDCLIGTPQGPTAEDERRPPEQLPREFEFGSCSDRGSPLANPPKVTLRLPLLELDEMAQPVQLTDDHLEGVRLVVGRAPALRVSFRGEGTRPEGSNQVTCTQEARLEVVTATWPLPEDGPVPPRDPEAGDRRTERLQVTNNDFRPRLRNANLELIADLPVPDTDGPWLMTLRALAWTGAFEAVEEVDPDEGLPRLGESETPGIVLESGFVEAELRQRIGGSLDLLEAHDFFADEDLGALREDLALSLREIEAGNPTAAADRLDALVARLRGVVGDPSLAGAPVRAIVQAVADRGAYLRRFGRVPFAASPPRE